MEQASAARLARQFRYLRDPVFLVAVAIYFVNRFAVKPFTGNPADFFHCWLNDVLCAPFWLPPLLLLARRVGLREHDAPPTVGELVLLVIVWSWLFEFAAPSPFLHMHFPNAVGDPWDVVAYAVGALIAGALWRSGRPPRPIAAVDAVSAPRQHLLCAAGIVLVTIAAAAVPLSGHAWQWSLKRETHLQFLVSTIEEFQRLNGRLPERLDELPRDVTYEHCIYRVENGSVVLIDLGTDNALGGVGPAADLWWPWDRQPPARWYAWFFTPDAHDAFTGVSLLGLAIAVVWLFVRRLRSPPFPRLTRRDLLRTAGALVLVIAMGVFVLVMQNELSIPSGH